LFYKNKETKQVVLVVKSDSKKTIIFEYNNKGITNGGKILDLSKTEFKKHYVKYKKCKFLEPDENMIKTILDDYETNKYAYENNFEEYIEDIKYQERKEAIEKQTEADRIRMLKELADDYNPNGVSIEQVKE
jgi:hypothetical protein